MSRRELKLLSALLVLTVVATTGVMVGLRLLGAPDEVTIALMIGVFSGCMFLVGFIPEDLPPDRR